jgi:hypothetical protein
LLALFEFGARGRRFSRRGRGFGRCGQGFARQSITNGGRRCAASSAPQLAKANARAKSNSRGATDVRPLTVKASPTTRRAKRVMGATSDCGAGRFTTSNMTRPRSRRGRFEASNADQPRLGRSANRL